MMQLRKTYIQRFYNAIKAYYNSEAKYEHLTPIQKIKFLRRLRKEAKQASEKFDMEIRWFVECLEGNDYAILMEMMLILCHFNVPIENVYEIFGTIGFELVD